MTVPLQGADAMTNVISLYRYRKQREAMRRAQTAEAHLRSDRIGANRIDEARRSALLNEPAGSFEDGSTAESGARDS